MTFTDIDAARASGVAKRLAFHLGCTDEQIAITKAADGTHIDISLDDCERLLDSVERSDKEDSDY